MRICLRKLEFQVAKRRIQASIGKTGETASTLNIRSGPGVEFPPVSDPLKRGTVVVLLEKRDRWNKVELFKNGDIEGWMHNRFLAKA